MISHAPCGGRARAPPAPAPERRYRERRRPARADYRGAGAPRQMPAPRRKPEWPRRDGTSVQQQCVSASSGRRGNDCQEVDEHFRSAISRCAATPSGAIRAPQAPRQHHDCREILRHRRNQRQTAIPQAKAEQRSVRRNRAALSIGADDAHGLAHAHATASGMSPKRRSRCANWSMLRGTFRGEIRPQRVEEQKLRIGRLPEQKIAQPPFAAGADHEIRLRQRAGEQARRKQFGRDRFGIETAFLGSARQFARGGRDLFLTAVVEGEGQIEAGVVDGAAFRLLDHLTDVVGDAAAMPITRTRTSRAMRSSRSLRK